MVLLMVHFDDRQIDFAGFFLPHYFNPERHILRTVGVGEYRNRLQ
jgi:hypothetical protein